MKFLTFLSAVDAATNILAPILWLNDDKGNAMSSAQKGGLTTIYSALSGNKMEVKINAQDGNTNTIFMYTKQVTNGPLCTVYLSNDEIGGKWVMMEDFSMIKTNLFLLLVQFLINFIQ
jgi:hypothetical protein